MAAVIPALTSRDLWVPTPARFARLMFGLTLFGLGEACLIAAELGNSPWTVLAQGIERNTPLTVGTATTLIAVALLLAFIPLRERVGIGTLAKALWVGVALDLFLLALPNDPPPVAQWSFVAAGIMLIALGSGLYLTAALGPGPRDALMTGLHRITGASLRLVRFLIEATVLMLGLLLGGAVGGATVLFALAIGPSVELAINLYSTPEWRALEKSARPPRRLPRPAFAKPSLTD